MIGFLAEKITDFFIENNIIKDDEKSIYKYGSEITLSTALGFILVLVTSILSKNIINGITFLVCFGSVRIFSGGYHASTYLKCNLGLINTFILILIIQNSIASDNDNLLHIVIVVISFVIISIMSPIENKNKPLSDNENKRYKKICIILSIAWTLLSMILLMLNIKVYLIISITMFTNAILMIAEKIKQKLKEKENNEHENC